MNTAVNNKENVESSGLNRVLGTWSLVAFGLAYLVPLTIFTTFGLVTVITKSHLPIAYVVTTSAMIFTAISYALLVRDYPAAGSAYTYAKRSFGAKVGFVTGWVLLLDYLLLPAINYLIIGIYIHAQFQNIPEYGVIISAIILVTIINIIGVSVVRNSSLFLVFIQLVFSIAFVALTVSRVDPQIPLLAPFFSEALEWSAILTGSAILCLSFLGFDAVSTLSEEALEPNRTVPRAIILTTVIGGSIFVILSLSATHIIPDWRTIEDPDSAAIQVMDTLAGQPLVHAFLAAFLSGAFASAVAAQASVSRVLFAMGRDQVLPYEIFGVLNRTFKTPVRAIVIVGCASLIVLFVSLDTLASVISFGALFAFSLVNLAAIKKFIFDDRRTSMTEIAIYGLTPLIGFGLTAWLWFSLSKLALIVGMTWMSVGTVYVLAQGRHASLESTEDTL